MPNNIAANEGGFWCDDIFSFINNRPILAVTG